MMLSFALFRQAGRRAVAPSLRNFSSPGIILQEHAIREGFSTSPLRSWASPRTWSPGFNARAGRQEVAPGLRKFSLARWSEDVRGKMGFLRGYGGGYGGSGDGGAQTVVWSLVGANLVVFGMWQTVDRTFMMDHFMVSVDAVMSGRLHTVVTSAFSQARFDHLAMNMLGLYFFGTEIAKMFGGKWLLNLYLAGGIAGSVGHLVYCAFVIPWLENIPRNRFNARYTPSALGASGAVNAIVLLHILLFPARIIMVNFFIPVPAALFGLYLIGSDVYQARNEGSRTAHAGHLGGALVGAAAWISLRRRRW